MSATFHEAGYAHLVELVHQKDGGARRQLASVRLTEATRAPSFASRSAIACPIPRPAPVTIVV